MFFYLKTCTLFHYTWSMLKWAEPEQQQEEGINKRHLAAGLAGGAVAGTPFLGLIGEKPIVHDPFFNKDIPRVNYDRLSELAQPGDILLTGKRKGTGWQYIQTHTGTPWYHAQPVVGRFGGQTPGAVGTTLSVNSLAAQNPNMSNNTAVKQWADTIKGEARKSHYSDMLLMRPKQKLTPEQLEKFVNRAVYSAREEYNIPVAIKGWLKDMFLPKIGKGTTALPSGYKPCKADTCGTMSAHSYSEATGKSPVAGKLPRDILPSHYLREGSDYAPVAARLSYEGPSRELLKRRAMLMRGGTGLALGVGTAAAIEDPATLPILPAFMAAPEIAQKLYGKYRLKYLLKHNKPVSQYYWMNSEKSMPGYGVLLDNLKETNTRARELRRNALRRSLPLSIAAAAGTYGLARLLKNKISPDEETAPPVRS
jgi:hypothetical protein